MARKAASTRTTKPSKKPRRGSSKPGTVGHFLEGLEPLEGKGAFTAAERKRLKHDQTHPRPSFRRRPTKSGK